ncbi:hypothetical protein [Falsibacillus albus]|uniref:hypothetical protein n=1 Tax=Falsibacillus albus TaxID=2478915 RepID=UPI0011E5C270|nr:hypothetical protein [Falsibacillus albus]
MLWCPSARETRAGGNQKVGLMPVKPGNASWRESERWFDARQGGKCELTGIRMMVWCPSSRKTRAGGNQKVGLMPVKPQNAS